ncbi:hypothetical protein HK097_000928 [Rhizophlyctis rosea]|uniref:Uncharacterized protein n=1 Tax=Rhizophlyctis rosea TaxID=64517 RepID=A0AAD5X4I7_9FUNG|nr:hypothetical protein HK097_000928 [Rhizophlyctis rosea]
MATIELLAEITKLARQNGRLEEELRVSKNELEQAKQTIVQLHDELQFCRSIIEKQKLDFKTDSTTGSRMSIDPVERDPRHGGSAGLGGDPRYERAMSEAETRNRNELPHLREPIHPHHPSSPHPNPRSDSTETIFPFDSATHTDSYRKSPEPGAIREESVASEDEVSEGEDDVGDGAVHKVGSVTEGGGKTPAEELLRKTTRGKLIVYVLNVENASKQNQKRRNDICDALNKHLGQILDVPKIRKALSAYILKLGKETCPIVRGSKGLYYLRPEYLGDELFNRSGFRGLKKLRGLNPPSDSSHPPNRTPSHEPNALSQQSMPLHTLSPPLPAMPDKVAGIQARHNQSGEEMLKGLRGTFRGDGPGLGDRYRKEVEIIEVDGNGAVSPKASQTPHNSQPVASPNVSGRPNMLLHGAIAGESRWREREEDLHQMLSRILGKDREELMRFLERRAGTGQVQTEWSRGRSYDHSSSSYGQSLRSDIPAGGTRRRSRSKTPRSRSRSRSRGRSNHSSPVSNTAARQPPLPSDTVTTSAKRKYDSAAGVDSKGKRMRGEGGLQGK